ncbi:meiotic recombination protein SPO11-1 isoform X1 [Rosa rugosa]|uniref:meiotic recombination protein SPO11-1 isoform X1 n=1 Tax=Rosa rugosa TaxID=74645 RepID=UPI002B414377|nr:meiotic recombination protein SPO11-1 isoform X1 [Rosa rugosa]
MEGKRSRGRAQPRPRHLLTKIKEFTRALVRDLSDGRSPEILIHRFRNYCSNPSANCYCSSDLPKGKETLTLRKETHVRRLDVLLRVLVIVQQLLQENRHGSKRDIYYMHPSIFSDQSVVDRAINDICILLQCSRHNLNVVSVGKGLVMGWLRFAEAGNMFDCINRPNTAYPVPVHVEEVKDIVSVAQYILVVEKESVFQRLANDQFCNTNHCIVITGCGYPDISTRRFLGLLVDTLHIPVYCLVDCDPYGFDILSTYRFGSLQMAYDAKFLRVPEIIWLGAFPLDSEKYHLAHQCLLPLTAEDKRKTEAMLQRCYLEREVPQWRLELQLMLERGVKFELEALSVHELSFLSTEYIPSKIQGAYSIDIDAEQSMVKVSGKVNPKIILQLLGGKHAKVKSIKFDSEEPSMGGGYPPPPPPLPPYGMGLAPHPYSYLNGGPYDYPMMMPPLLMLPPSPPPSSVAAQPQQKPTLLLEAPPQNSGATAQPQNSGTSAPPTTNVAKEAVIPSDNKSKRCGIVKNCSIM